MKTISLLALFFVTACGSKPGDTDTSDTDTSDTDTSDTDTSDTDTSDTDTETGDTEVEVNPKPGNYMTEFTEFSLDECDIKDGEMGSLLEEDLQLWFTLDGTELTFIPVEDGQVGDHFPCTITDDSFECPIDTDTETFGELDATLTMAMFISGEWAADDEITGQLNFDITCDGADCDKAIVILENQGSPFIPPCLSTIAFEGSWTADDVPEVPAVVAEEGSYSATLQKFSKDECAVKDSTLDGFANGTYTIDMAYRGGSLYSQLFYKGNALGKTIECKKNGPIYDCPFVTKTWASRGYDAEYTEVLNHDGEWIASNAISGTFNYNLTCKGAECAKAVTADGVAATVPCETQITYTGKKQ